MHTICAFRVLNPHQGSLTKTKCFTKLKSDAPKVPKQAETEKDGVKNPYNSNSIQLINFYTENFDALKATNQLTSIKELGYMCPRGLSSPQAVTLTEFLKYKKRLVLRYIKSYSKW